MERVWRKVNQGLTMRSSSTKNAQPVASSATMTTGCLPVPGFQHSTDTTSSAGFGGESQVVAVQQRRRTNPPQGSTTASSEKRRRRRRRSRPNREGNSQGGGNGGHSSSAGHHKNHSSSSRRSNNQLGLMAQTGNEQSLRQRAVARLKMFNFNLNWDLHMNQCKPCGPKSGNIITRRLCRNRRGEDNELYRSNSFKFERFERKEQGGTGSRTLRKQTEMI
ncbi:AAEL004962-PA [Aedes aegypti]|uniref:AAEL004962-PA n=1 Tax=Aedes aegypti TaxID=7159 RepID=Q17BH6_AEDAE|nr:AAEL004962-PA [Aedes aegypti]